MKKLTRTSLSALKNASTVLTEQQQRSIRGGCSLDEMGTGYWIGDNYYWNRTSECTCGGSYNYGNGGNGSSDYYYGYMGPDNPISQSEFYRLLGEGCWYGGYVEELGYVSAEANVYSLYGGSTNTYYAGTRIIRNYYESLGDYIGSGTTSFWEEVANGILGYISIYGSYINNHVSKAQAAVSNAGYTGPIIVESIISPSGSHTDLSMQMKVYGGGGELIYDSENY